jgi:hypothetical protein
MKPIYGYMIIIGLGACLIIVGISNSDRLNRGYKNSLSGEYPFSKKTYRIIHIIFGAILLIAGIILLVINLHS